METENIWSQNNYRSLGKVLVTAQEKSAVLLQEITQSTARAEKKKQEVLVVKNKVEGEAAIFGSDT